MLFTWSIEYWTAGDTLLPIGDERILVGRWCTLFKDRLPSAIWIHGIETLRLGGESFTSLAGSQSDHLIFRSDVKSVLHRRQDTGYHFQRRKRNQMKQKKKTKV